MLDATSAWLDAAFREQLLTHREELAHGRLIQAWQQWPGGVAAAPALVRRRGLRARDRVVKVNLRRVVSQARRYCPRAKVLGMEKVDLRLEGVIGLQRAAEKFDQTRGYKFSTYAVPWIRQAMGRLLEQHGALTKLPCQVGSALSRYRNGSLAWDAMPRGLQKRVQAAMVLDRPLSLDARLGEDDTTLGELIAA